MRIRSWTTGLAIATLAVAAPGASAETVTFSEPFEVTVLNNCLVVPEPVLIQGTLHIKSTGTLTLDGLKSQVEVNTSGVTGTAPFDVKYTMNSQSSDMQHASDDDAQQTFEQTLNMTRQGETGTFVMGDDARFHMIVHLTTVNNVTKASQLEIRDDCS
jgi:hypothetical protein